MKKIRHSKQRERIFEILKNTGIHPTANWIYNQLKNEFPNLSMGTVYRNLNILIEQGYVKKIDFASTFGRFEANIHPHYHFICEKCGAVKDLDMPIDKSLNEKVNQQTNYQTKHHRIEFYGICDECKN